MVVVILNMLCLHATPTIQLKSIKNTTEQWLNNITHLAFIMVLVTRALSERSTPPQLLKQGQLRIACCPPSTEVPWPWIEAEAMRETLVVVALGSSIRDRQGRRADPGTG